MTKRPVEIVNTQQAADALGVTHNAIKARVGRGTFPPPDFLDSQEKSYWRKDRVVGLRDSPRKRG